MSCRKKRKKHAMNTIVSVNVLPKTKTTKKTCREHYRFCKCLAEKRKEKKKRKKHAVNTIVSVNVLPKKKKKKRKKKKEKKKK